MSYKKLTVILSTIPTFLIPTALSIQNLTIFPNTVKLQDNLMVSWTVQDGDPTSMNLQFLHGDNLGSVFPGIQPMNNINPHAASSVSVSWTQVDTLIGIGRYHFNVTGLMAPSGASGSTGSASSNPLSVAGTSGSAPSSSSSGSLTSTTTTTSTSTSPTFSSTTDQTSSPFPSSTSTQSSKPKPIGAIVGGTIGGLSAIAVVLLALICMQRRRNVIRNEDPRHRAEPFSINTPLPQMSDARQTGLFSLGPNVQREEVDFGPVTIESPRWDVEVVPPTYDRIFPSSQSQSYPTTTATATSSTSVSSPVHPGHSRKNRSESSTGRGPPRSGVGDAGSISSAGASRSLGDSMYTDGNQARSQTGSQNLPYKSPGSS
ncbi:hypothetical protein BDQ17DRAFT_236864 [Cyathus striatus]|nr:hypothetical protein BDQ17DRAFT_236864 [Cyathus striatus]